MKKILTYNIEMLKVEVMVCVGVGFNEMQKFINKKAKKEVKELYENPDFKKDIEDLTNGSNAGFVGMKNLKDINYYYVWLKSWENTWYCLNILNHEIVHLRQAIFARGGIENETEFEAYFQETVFNGIRQALNKACTKNKKK